MSLEEYTPRFAFEITEEQKERAAKLLSQHGSRRAIFSRILDDVLDMIDEHGPMCMGLLISGAVKPREIVPTMAKVQEKQEKLEDKNE